MKKFLTIFAVLSVIATPTFAQSFDPEFGTGNVLPFSHKSTDNEGKSAFRQDGLRAYAKAPSKGLVGNSDAPSATGGGSIGYNELLRTTELQKKQGRPRPALFLRNKKGQAKTCPVSEE